MASFQLLSTSEPQDNDMENGDSDCDDVDGEVFSERFGPTTYPWESTRAVHLSNQSWCWAAARIPANKVAVLLISVIVGVGLIAGHVPHAAVDLHVAATKDVVQEDAPLVSSPIQTTHPHVPGECCCHPCTCECPVTNASMCDTFVCPIKYVPKDSAAHIKGADLETCCDPRDTCDHLACDEGSEHDVGPEHLLCAGAVCSQEVDAELCCPSRSPCSKLECPEGYESVPNPEDVLCERHFCSISEDLLTCCSKIPDKEQASCDSYTCPAWGYKKDQAGEIMCKATPCTFSDDFLTCCEEAGKCSSYTCPQGYEAKIGGGARFCKSKMCDSNDRDTCCNPKEPPPLPPPRDVCSTMICPPGTVKAPNQNELLCKGSPCTEADDTDTCCLTPPEPVPEDCSTYTCPPGQNNVANNGIVVCSIEKGCDVDTCCEEFQPLPVQEDCSVYLCPPGQNSVAENGVIVLCSIENGCDVDTCCEEFQVLSTSPENIVVPTTQTEPDFEAFDDMVCNLNCYSNVGATDITIDAEPGQPAPDSSKEACRAACEYTEECQGVVYMKDWTEGTSSICHGKKDIHLSKCVPGGDYTIEIIKEHVWGKCVLMGDPHIVQWDRPYGDPVNAYSTGDFRLIQSTGLLMDVRLDFTERFPEAASATGVAVHGAMIQNSWLVVVYTGPSGWQNGFKVFLDGKQILTEYPSTYSDDLLVAQFAAMEPNDYHHSARHTIGGTEGTLPSYSFEFQNIPLNIYCLLGPDNMNIVIEMQKLPVPQDGLCGNFNCDDTDDFLHDIRDRGNLADALPTSESIFSKAVEVPPIKVQAAQVRADLLDKCDPNLLEKAKTACGQHMAEAEMTGCLIDVCEANSLEVASLLDAAAQVEQQVQEDLLQHEV